MSLQESIVTQLERAGFRVVRRTSALVFLVHPNRPGLLVRVGTVYVVAECNGREATRQRLDAVDVETLLRRCDGEMTELGR
ncbi:MAG: hypothetical protein NZL87_07600 [Thermomicrobium sp.]|nr:hypothetical protein [Thermomicrobium sp.]MDW7981393.1 hypothetical protein [Thermomicrobium sp.]